MPRRFNDKKGSLYIREIPSWLRDLFHAACVMRGKTIRSVMIEFMAEYVGENTPKIKLKNRKTKSQPRGKTAHKKEGFMNRRLLKGKI